MQPSLAAPEEVGPLIALARRRLKQVVTARLVRYELGSQQFWVLLNLRKHDGISLHELAQLTWTDDPTACRIIGKLIERGLVRSNEDEDDRRRFRLSLTAKGVKLTGELEGLADEVRGTLARGLSGDEKKKLCGYLRRVITNIETLNGDGQENGRSNAGSKRVVKRAKRGKN